MVGIYFILFGYVKLINSMIKC